MPSPRLIGACAVTAAGVVIAVVAAVAALAPASTASEGSRALSRPMTGAPIAYDVKEHQRSHDSSVPSASSLPLQNPAVDPAPTF